MAVRFGLALFASILCVGRAYDCQFVDQNGVSYDLSPLQNSDTDYELNKGGVTYWINLCQASTSLSCKSDTAACVVPNNGDEPFSIGSTLSMVSYGPANSTAVIALQFSNGDWDARRQIARSMQINFVCGGDLGDSTDSIKLLDKDVPADFWTFEWTTALVCAANNSNSTDGDSSSSASIDPFLVTLSIVVPVLLLILFIVSVAFCCHCCRRRRAERCARSLPVVIPALTPNAPPKSTEKEPLMQQQQQQTHLTAASTPYGFQYAYGAIQTPYGLQPVQLMPGAQYGAGNVQADGPVYMPFMFQQQQIARPYATLMEEPERD